jgi:drug/metabolite transporter (DMT)-like permease
VSARLPRAYLAGAALMVLSVTLTSCLDTILRLLASRHDPIFLAFGRHAVQAGALALLAPPLGPARVFRTSRPGLQAARGLCLLAATVFVVLALQRLTMAQTYAIAFSTPLVATALAAILLGERATGRQVACVAAGFAGVLVSLDVTAPGASPALLLPLAMAAFNAGFQVLTRLGGRDQHPYAMLFYGSLFAGLAAAPALPWTAGAMAPRDAGLLVVGGLFGTAGHLCLVHAFRLAPTVIVSPMVYLQLVAVGLIGYGLFGEVPSAATVAGGVIVAASGIALLRAPAR